MLLARSLSLLLPKVATVPKGLLQRPKTNTFTGGAKPSVGWTRELERSVFSKKTHGLRERQFNRPSKAARKEEQGINLILTVGRQVQDEGLPHTKWLHWNTNGVILNVLAFLLLPSALIAENSPMVWNIP